MALFHNLLPRAVAKFRRVRLHRQIQTMMSRVAADNAQFDRTYAVDTAADVSLDDYDLSEESRQGAAQYQGMHEGGLRAIIENLVPDPREFDFLDVGSGKGKAMLVASMFPFRRVLGAELSPKLHEMAVGNISAFRAGGHTRSEDIASLCIDARDIPDLGPMSLIFLANPFDEGPMQGFVKRLESQAKGRTMLVAYINPRARKWFDESATFTTLLETRRLVVYAAGDYSLSDRARDALEKRFNAYKV